MDADTLDRLGTLSNALATVPTGEGVWQRLLEGAMSLTGAAAGLVLAVAGERLRPVASRGPAGNTQGPPALGLLDREGRPDTGSPLSYAVHRAVSVRIDDLGASSGFDLAALDTLHAWRRGPWRSLLAVPVPDEEGVAALVVLLDPARPETGLSGGFGPESQRLVETLAWQAALLVVPRAAKADPAAAVNVVKGPGLVRRIDASLLAQRLSLIGIGRAAAESIAAEVLAGLHHEGREQIKDAEMEGRVCTAIERRFIQGESGRFRAWSAFRRSGLSLLVLIGGGSGSGKSTLASELSLRLDIGRIQSTDTLREVMRLLVSEHLAPELHRSTYQAWRCLPRLPEGLPAEARVIEGFRAQADKVAVAVRGVVKRTLAERESAILEGAHIHPALQRDLDSGDGVVVPLLVAVPDREELKRHFQWRAVLAPGRAGHRHLEELENVWGLQRHLVEEAAALGVAVIPNLAIEPCVRQALALISEALVARFPPPA